MVILIIAGGTGGHVYPALSIAQEFNNNGNSISWIGQENSLEERICYDEKYSFYPIRARGFLGKGLIGKITAIYFLTKALIKSLFLLNSIKPDLIISTGGYVSIAPGLVGSLFYPLFIHEQNSIAGLANKILHSRSRITFEAFPLTFSNLRNKVNSVGNPIRADIQNLALSAAPDLSKFKILVLGGSQGSQQINDILCSALENKIIPPGWSFTHQTGRLECAKLIEVYEKCGVEFAIKEYIKDISEEYKNCDIVISRSGAMTVSEICAAGKPSILLPLPWSSDNHQYLNANYLVEKGASEIIESDISNSEKLFDLLIELEKNHNRRDSMMKSASMVFPESASENIYKIINESLKI